MSSLLLLARARGLTWSLPLLLAVVGAGAWCAHALESQQRFDAYDRVPAVVAAGLVASLLAISALHTADEQLDGATPRPTKTAVLSIVLGLVGLGGLAATLLLPFDPFERGGAELARNLIGLTGLGILGASVAGNAVGWTVPFAWTGVSYLGVPSDYASHPNQAIWGWLLFPASWPSTWLMAIALLIAGLAGYAWAGFQPRPRQHPLR